MLVVVIATICLANGACTEKVVTDQATLMSCGSGLGQAAIVKWMEEEGYTARGYRLAKWGCAIGGKKVAA